MDRNTCRIVILFTLGLCTRGQQNGDKCVDNYTNTAGRCTLSDQCQSAKVDFQQNGIRPTFCSYSAFDKSLVCCRDGGTILEAGVTTTAENTTEIHFVPQSPSSKVPLGSYVGTAKRFFIINVFYQPNHLRNKKMTTVCRVCLGNEKLNNLVNDSLIDVYNKLSIYKFNSEDARPRALCCFCYKKLQTCHTFYEMTLESEKVFTQLLDKGLENSRENNTELNFIKEQQLSDNKHGENTSNYNTDVIIKIEPASEDEEHYEGFPNMPSEGKQVEIELVPIEVTQVKEEQITVKIEVINIENEFVKNEPVSSTDITNSQTTKKMLYEKYVLVKPLSTDTGDLNKRFVCKVCNKQFDQKSSVTRHILIHTGEKPYACNDCDKRYNRKSVLVDHRKIHTGVKPHACKDCKKSFNSKSNLVNHLRVHTGEKPFNCDACDKQFNQKCHLVYHLQTHCDSHEIRPRPFACDECEKRFYRKKNLMDHMRTHTVEKPFTCQECEKEFKNKSNLVVHMRLHTGEKRFVCKVCDRQFSQKKQLIYHRTQTHPGRNLIYACNVCSMTFIRKMHLSAHMNSHPGKKLFSCSLCDKQFNYQGNFVTHMNSHTGEKPFACNICEKHFTKKSSLIRHMKIHARKGF